MTREEFEADQIKRKGYVCPANIFNPELFEKPAAEVCPSCEHYKNDCVLYGKKKGRW